MKKILTFFCFLMFVCANGQPDQTSGKSYLSESEFQKAVNDYLEMTMTDTYKANKASQIAFSQKMGDNDVPIELAEEESWRRWITQNLSKTNFKSIGEAIEMRRIGLELTTKLAIENKDLYDMIKRASKEQRKVILKPESTKPF